MRPVDTRPLMDQEDRANQALGALDALHDLVACHDPLCRIKPEPFSYLLLLVVHACHDAIPDGTPKHGRAVNDEDSG